MRVRLTCPLLCLCCFILGVSVAGGIDAWAAHLPEIDHAFGHTGEADTRDQSGGASIRRDSTPPQKAYDLLARLRERGGETLPGYIGGRTFKNRERRLPAGRYREYDVNPKRRGRPRDAERIVIEQDTGKAYYTGDHYRTFLALN
ncbi:putative Guanyl-specific ribonuclease Sa3 [Nitrospira sp. KM1]|uniref:ribonuclease domain-containing protein n=1 Tax=Nitrospira sp. KM1 TaxID=1936990 RepID=UPI0013A75FFA|nr:ribonuclease domain-containing protein [Nitrospira sp. KM1]BCA55136.1 putative Guanyl-specific ribonuclease Sa3 [Nitrospira sp. KM1]